MKTIVKDAIRRIGIDKRKYKQHISNFLFLVLMSLQVAGQDKPRTELTHLTNEISELNNIFNEAFVKKNIEELLSRYDKGLILLPPNAPKSIGTEGIETLYKYVLANDISLKHTVEEIEYSDDYSQAIVIGNYETIGDNFYDIGTYLFVLKRKNDTWTITVDMYNSDKPTKEK